LILSSIKHNIPDMQTQRATNEVYGGVEAGGTKFLCAIGTGPTDLITQRFETTTPEETIGKVIGFFKPYLAVRAARRLAAIGIASFGPLDLDRASPRYGYITTTPKPGWANVDLAGMVKATLNIPVAIDTDVNGAALGEREWGAAQGLDTFIYVTVGTGIGGGGVFNGSPMHGLVHPEMGHILISRDPEEVPGFRGSCKFHEPGLSESLGYGCWEGLASGASMHQRWGKSPEKIPESDKNYARAWRLEANYLALGLYDLICTLSPQRIILGGGIMDHPDLLDMVQRKVEKLLNKYVVPLDSLEKVSLYLVRPALKDTESGIFLSGVLGAIALARRIHKA
jgi:fructokinase